MCTYRRPPCGCFGDCAFFLCWQVGLGLTVCDGAQLKSMCGRSYQTPHCSLNSHPRHRHTEIKQVCVIKYIIMVLFFERSMEQSLQSIYISVVTQVCDNQNITSPLHVPLDMFLLSLYAWVFAKQQSLNVIQYFTHYKQTITSHNTQ